MSAERPAVVAVGYNRPEALDRLLASLVRATYPPGTPLVISLDHSDTPAVAALAERFEWPHGPKRVILHPAQLGLRAHILACGDLALEYGGVILFEDDIVAAPHFYDFVLRAAAAYADEPRVGGVALYSYRINEFNNLDFEPLVDGFDVYFLQVAASWGQAWTAAQWTAFRAWYATNHDRPIKVSDGVPRQLEAWKASSWKKYYIKYLVETGRWFVYPRPSLSTNTARPGTHTKREVSIYQTPLDLAPRDWRLPAFDESGAVYDVFYEATPETLVRRTPDLGPADFDVDLMGIKPAAVLRRERLLSARPCARAQRRFALVGNGSPDNDVACGKDKGFFSLGARRHFGTMTLRRRLRLAKAANPASMWNKVFYQLLKPLQTELTIAMARRAARKSAQ